MVQENIVKIVNINYAENTIKIGSKSKIVSVFCNNCELMSKDKYDDEKHSKLHQVSADILLCPKCSLAFTDLCYYIIISGPANTGVLTLTVFLCMVKRKKSISTSGTYTNMLYLVNMFKCILRCTV